MVTQWLPLHRFPASWLAGQDLHTAVQLHRSIEQMGHIL